MLAFDEFRSQIEGLLPPGTVMQNPGGGITTIKGYSSRNVQYIRGKSPIGISIADLFSAYVNFRGKQVSSRDLNDYNARVFGRAGHPCNCTFLFMVLTRLGLTDGIWGEGKSRQPFYTTFL